MEAGTRGTILGLTICELVVFFIMLKKDKKKAVVFLSISLLLIVGIATYHLIEPLRNGRIVAQMSQVIAGNTHHRSALFKNTIEMSLDNPFGVGINNFEYLHPKYANLDTRPSPYVSDSTILRTPHNISLKMLAEVGYIGGVVFILIVLSILWSCLNSAYYGKYIE